MTVSLFLLGLMIIYFSFGQYMNKLSIETTIQTNTIYLQEQHIQTVEKILEGYRELKHGYGNYLYGLETYIHSEDWEGLKKYYSEIQPSVSAVFNDSVSALTHIKNIQLFSLLSNKLNLADEKNIQVITMIDKNIQIHYNPKKIAALCFVIGNFMDNAIEAVENEVLKQIIIQWTNEDNESVLSIKNTFNCEETLKKQGYDRGQGLQLIDSKLKQYADIINNTYINENVWFVQELIFIEK